MKNYLLGAVALIAIAAPAAANAQTSGYVGATYGNVDVDGLGDASAWGGEGAVAFQATDTLGVEIDGALVDGEDSDTTGGLTGHLFTRNDNYLFGGFVGFVDGDGSTTWQGGLEANKYFQSWTLAGSIAYANNDDADIDGTAANVEGRFFVNDNFRLNANAAYAHVDAGLIGDDNVWTLGAGGEYQLSSIPVSFGAGYAHSEFDDANLDVDAWTVSLRYNFGAGTLRDRDRNGASQASVSGISSSLGF